MRSTFWPNCICERQICQSRHTGRKFSRKRENSALLIKIVQNARFRSCAAYFGQIAFLSVKVVKIVTLAWNSLQNGKTVRFPWKLYKTLFSGHAPHRFGQIAFLSVKVLKIVTLVWNSLQNGKTVRFSWKLYKTLFSGHAEHLLPKSHLWEWKLSKSSHWPQILSKTGKQCAFHENCRSCAARFGKIAFLSTKVVNSSHWPQILFKTAKQCAFHENCTKRSFQVMRSTFWPNQICERQTSKNPYSCPKFSSKRENSALFL